MTLKHRAEMEAFGGLFFAFDKRQLAEGMEKNGLTIADTDKICSIGMGGYMLKSKVDDFDAMLERHNNDRKAVFADRAHLLDALVYELRNHEFPYTYETDPALNALGLTFEEVDAEVMREAMALAGGESEGDSL